MAKRDDQSHIVEEKADGSGYKCTEGDWGNSAPDSDGRDNGKRHENNTFGMG